MERKFNDVIEADEIDSPLQIVEIEELEPKIAPDDQSSAGFLD